MPKDLTAISELQPGQLAALHDRLGIRSLEELVRADRRAIQAALVGLPHQPSLEGVSRWQDQAHDLLARSPRAPDPQWYQVAAFVVSFERRGDQRRVVVEQAEHEPPEPRAVVDEWRVADALEWMASRVAPAERGPGDRG